MVGRREPANRAAEESTLHESAALRRRVLLHVRLSLPEDHPHLEQPALGSQPTSLFQARTLRSLPSRHWPGQTREQLYSLPPRLCREIAESLNGKGEALPHRRIHLETATRPDRPPRAVHRHLPGAEQIREDGGADLSLSHPGSVHDGWR